MGLTELFNEWIVERGSAKVQEKHIAFFRDQLAAADKKTTLLEKKITELEAENEKLKSDLQESQEENEILRSKIQEYEQPTEQPTHNNLLEDIKVKILVHLSNQGRTTEESLASFLGIGVDVAKFHLTELRKNKLASINIRFSAPPLWSLDHEGRRFLIENALIS